jgi:hypothetical protein
MPRGPGTADTLKLPAGWPRTAPYLVWSYWQGAWWVVDHGGDPTAMAASAAARRVLTASGTRGNARLGTKPLAPMPESRFVVTDRHGDPQAEWEASR